MAHLHWQVQRGSLADAPVVHVAACGQRRDAVHGLCRLEFGRESDVSDVQVGWHHELAADGVVLRACGVLREHAWVAAGREGVQR